MRKFFVILLALAMLVSVMAVPALAYIGHDGAKPGGGGSSDTPPQIIAEGEGKQFGDGNVEDNENYEESSEAAPEESSEAAPEESSEVTPEESSEAASEEPSESQSEPESGLETEAAETEATEADDASEEEAGSDKTEMYLLIGVISGLAAICVVLLIRSGLDL